MRTPSTTLIVLPLGLAAAAGGAAWQEQGAFGTTYPKPAAVIVDDTLVHQDRLGGAGQVLLDLAASGEGVAAVWRDTRFGSLALVAGLLGPDGVPLDFERSVSDQQTARQFDPSVAIGGDFTGGVAWFGTRQAGSEVMLRLFAGEAGFVSAPIPVERGREAGRGGGGGREGGRGDAAAPATDGRGRAVELRRPGLGIDADGRGLVVWHDGEELRGQRFRRGFARGRGGFEPEPDGELFRVGAGGPEAIGGPLVALRPEGTALVLWPTSKGCGLWTDADGAGRSRAGKLTDVERILADPGGEGWWAVGRRRGRAVVARIGLELKIEELLELPAEVVRADLAPVDAGFALVAELAPDAGRPPFRLGLHGADGTPLGEPIAFPTTAGAEARGVRIAATGAVVVAAWTDRRDVHDDVRYATFGLGAEVLEPRAQDERWNTDEASSDQTNAALDLVDGRGWLAWEDERHGSPAIYARRVDASGPTGPEVRLSAPDSPGVEPAIAARADGGALVVWKAGVEGDRRVSARLLSAGGAAADDVVVLDAERRASGAWPAAVEGLDDGGFAVLFTRDDDRVSLARLDADGKPVDGPRDLARERGDRLRHPDLTTLSDGRLLALWDVAAERRPAELAGRFLTAALKPTGGDLSFEASPEDLGDLDPAAAPGPDGGFLMVWTGRDGPLRDVVARPFDRRGKPLGPLLPISVRATEQDRAAVEALDDGSWVVVWEDDVSGYDQVLARRVDGAFGLGPRVTVNHPETDFVEARSGPTAAAAGAGLMLAWTDRRRSQGLDVYFKSLGVDFDDVGGPRVPERR